MFKKLLVVLLFAISVDLATAREKIYFMPDESNIAINEIIKTINSARSTIDIAMYTFTNKTLANALKQQARRGIKINIIYDQKSNIDDGKPQRNSTIGHLAKLKNINIYTLKGLKNTKSYRSYCGIMHHKIMIVDDDVAVLGSANWTKAAFSINYENVIVTNNQEITTKAIKYYKMMLKRAKKY